MAWSIWCSLGSNPHTHKIGRSDDVINISYWVVFEPGTPWINGIKGMISLGAEYTDNFLRVELPKTDRPRSFEFESLSKKGDLANHQNIARTVCLLFETGSIRARIRWVWFDWTVLIAGVISIPCYIGEWGRAPNGIDREYYMTISFSEQYDVTPYAPSTPGAEHWTHDFLRITNNSKASITLGPYASMGELIDRIRFGEKTLRELFDTEYDDATTLCGCFGV